LAGELSSGVGEGARWCGRDIEGAGWWRYGKDGGGDCDVGFMAVACPGGMCQPVSCLRRLSNDMPTALAGDSDSKARRKDIYERGAEQRGRPALLGDYLQQRKVGQSGEVPASQADASVLTGHCVPLLTYYQTAFFLRLLHQAPDCPRAECGSRWRKHSFAVP